MPVKILCQQYSNTSLPVCLVCRFEGGLIEQYCNASEGLAASMEVSLARSAFCHSENWTG